jgi:hypothetical protein
LDLFISQLTVLLVGMCCWKEVALAHHIVVVDSVLTDLYFLGANVIALTFAI